MKEEVLLVGGLAIVDGEVPRDAPATRRSRSDPRSSSVAIAVLPPRGSAARSARHLDRYQAIAERLLIGDLAGDIAPIAAASPSRRCSTPSHCRLRQLGIDPMQADIEAHYRWIERRRRQGRHARRALARAGAIGTTPDEPSSLTYAAPRPPRSPKESTPS